MDRTSRQSAPRHAFTFAPAADGKTHVGFMLPSGFRAADVVGLQAILGLPPTAHRSHFLAAQPGEVRGAPNTTLVATTAYEACPALDVVVLPDFTGTRSDADRAFATAAVREARVAIALGQSVALLGEAGALHGKNVAAPAAGLPSAWGATAASHRPGASHHAVDGGLYTSHSTTGAIEAAFAVLNALRGPFFTRLAELTLEYCPEVRFADTPPVAPVRTSKPLRVGVLAAPNMYMPDVVGAVDALSALPETRVHYVAKRVGPVRTVLGPTVIADTTFADCPPLDVVVLGAHMPGQNASAATRAFLRAHVPTAQATIAVCAGSVLLGAAGLIEGKVATSNFHMTGLLPACGATVAGEEVAACGALYTAGPAIGSFEAGLLAIRDLRGPAAAAYVEQHHLQYAPAPLHGVGTPEAAGPWLTFLSRGLIAPLLPLYRWYLAKGRRAARRAPPIPRMA